MNYLAHLILADVTGPARLGGLLGDFVQGEVRGRFDVATAVEILLHRKIDAFTDAHPAVREARQHFVPAHRRYAGILLDVFYDHALIQHWSRYHAVDLLAFVDDVHGLLRTHAATLPERLREMAPHMIERGLLLSYRDMAGVELAIRRVARRLKQGEPLIAGIDDLYAHYDALLASFDAFYPELIAFAAATRPQLTAQLRDTPA